MPSMSDMMDVYLKSGDPRMPHPRLFKFINSFSVVGITSLLVFGLIHFWEGSPVVGSIELVCGAAGIGNILALRATRNTRLASSTILIIMLGVLWLLLLSGGLYDTGILWFFTFPALAFFMKGNGEGVWWMAAEFAEIIIAMIAVEFYPGIVPFSGEVLRQLMASLLAVTFLVYFYQMIHEEEDVLLRKRTKELIDYGWKEKSDKD